MPLLDPFALALRRIEFESNRLIQAQILFLKSADLLPFRRRRERGRRKPSRAGAQAVGRHAVRHWRGTRHRPIDSDPGNGADPEAEALIQIKASMPAPLHLRWRACKRKRFRSLQ